MAQVNSSPGQNQVLGTVAVAPGLSVPGAGNTRTVAAATTVTYSQSEPGRKNDTSEGKRS